MMTASACALKKRESPAAKSRIRIIGLVNWERNKRRYDPVLSERLKSCIIYIPRIPDKESFNALVSAGPYLLFNIT